MVLFEIVSREIILKDFARPSSLSVRIGLFRGEPGDQVVLHHVLQGVTLHKDRRKGKTNFVEKKYSYS
jgi:hypothetical protein